MHYSHLKLCCWSLLMSYIHYWNQWIDRQWRRLAWHINRWKCCLCSWTKMCFISSCDNLSGHLNQETMQHVRLNVQNMFGQKGQVVVKIVIVMLSSAGVLSWHWWLIGDALCNIAKWNLVNRSISWWAIGLFLYIFRLCQLAVYCYRSFMFALPLFTLPWPDILRMVWLSLYTFNDFV